MKFSDITPSEWPELREYFDTCALPVTGLAGSEQPWQATEALERLRDLLDAVEIPFKGRIVTYPAYHYSGGAWRVEVLRDICSLIKSAGFQYIIIVTACSEDQIDGMAELSNCDLLLRETDMASLDKNNWHSYVRQEIQSMWNRSRTSAEL